MGMFLSRLRPHKQSDHQPLHLLGNAVIEEGGADVLAGGDEVRTFFEGYFGGDVCGAFGCRCEFRCKGSLTLNRGMGNSNMSLSK